MAAGRAALQITPVRPLLVDWVRRFPRQIFESYIIDKINRTYDTIFIYTLTTSYFKCLYFRITRILVHLIFNKCF